MSDDTPRQQPPSWATLAAAKKVLTPRPPEVADLTDDELMTALIDALCAEGRLGEAAAWFKERARLRAAFDVPTGADPL